MYSENSALSAPSKPLVIHTVNSPAGCGKSYAAHRRTIDLIRSDKKNVLIVVPTIKLMNQTVNSVNDAAKEKNHKVNVRAFSSTHEDSVIESLMQYFKESPSQGMVAVITQVALERIPFIFNIHNWLLIYDESTQGDYRREFSLSDNRHLLNAFTAIPCYGAENYSKLEIKDTKLVNYLSKNETRDEANEIVSDLATKMKSGYYDMYVLTDQFDRYKTRTKERCNLEICGLLKPELFAGFAGVTIMCANLEDTIFYKYWSNLPNVTFIKDKSIKTRYDTHTNGDLMTFYYATDKRYWSKTTRDIKVTTETGDKVALYETYVDRIEELLADEEFLWIANKDISNDLFKHTRKGIRLPNTPHGMNEYQDIDNVAVLSSYHQSASHLAFLYTFAGIDEEDAKAALNKEATYQAIMRSSGRDPDNKNEKKYIVADISIANWLSAKFPGSQVLPLPGIDYTPAAKRAVNHSCVMTHAERCKALRLKKITQCKDELNALNDHEISPFTKVYSHEISVPHFGSFFSSKFAEKSFAQIKGISLTNFLEILREASLKPNAGKDLNLLISNSEFNPDLSEDTNRGLENITSISGIWLDNDGGGIPYEDFAAIFPKLMMVAYNTYSSSKEDPRYRVFIPTTHLLGKITYKEIITQIKSKLQTKGYVGASALKKDHTKRFKDHGFDEGKFTPAALFYLPCQAKNPEDSFYQEFLEGREALNPYLWVDKSMKITKEELIEEKRQEIIESEQSVSNEDGEVIQTINETKVDKAIERWRSSPKGSGNAEFNVLAWKLRAGGMSTHEIQRSLYLEASFAASPGERRSQIKSIMSNMEKKFQKRSYG